jgi:hypothetical protein
LPISYIYYEIETETSTTQVEDTMENLMSILTALPLSTMIVMFLVGSLAMALGFDAASRGKKGYLLVSVLFYVATLPLVIFLIGSDGFAILGGVLVSAVIGVLLMKAMQLVMIVTGAIRYEDIYSEEADSKS